ncbi:hypothetical protein CI105_07120 [Candidatus Izimaplasma bacterium ZiA1]|uniref:electron transfer flavoprotein subunit alpha/FixB family protein n=1 Tax=Candidatus Izimoplasma sp. ZiA1 TaxID=2024899 RepID=UPI000BAA487F|nr:hypothetical protein CI105_07120 [Candidatus Izimaplasma bacterium ZiA1]
MKIALITDYNILNTNHEINSVLSKISNLNPKTNNLKIDLLYISKQTIIKPITLEQVNEIHIYNQIEEPNNISNLIKVALHYNNIYTPDLFISCLKENQDAFIPQLASKLSIESFLNIESIKFDNETQKFNVIKPIYSGNVLGHYIVSDRAVLSFTKEKTSSKLIKVSNVPIIKYIDYTDATTLKDDIVTFEKVVPSGIKDAKFVIVCGYGVGSANNIELLKDYAKSVNAVICGTKKVIDLGWLPMNTLIGTTGQIISPDICLTIGVSGAAPLLNGIIKSKLIIAINKDKDARIFNYADYGIVGDYKDIIEKEHF